MIYLYLSVGFGMPRREITKYKDEVRGEMPHDESTISRQTSGWKDGTPFLLNLIGLSGIQKSFTRKCIE
jgi:hypothetical protein